MRGGEVDTKDVRVGMLGCEGNGPDAGAAAKVDDMLIRRGGYRSTVEEAIVLKEPYAVLKVCRIDQLGEWGIHTVDNDTRTASLGLLMS